MIQQFKGSHTANWLLTVFSTQLRYPPFSHNFTMRFVCVVLLPHTECCALVGHFRLLIALNLQS
jgi:hypothetical protein